MKKGQANVKPATAKRGRPPKASTSSAANAPRPSRKASASRKSTARVAKAKNTRHDEGRATRTAVQKRRVQSTRTRVPKQPARERELESKVDALYNLKWVKTPVGHDILPKSSVPVDDWKQKGDRFTMGLVLLGIAVVIIMVFWGS